MAELVKLICHDYMSKRWCIVKEAKRVQVDLLWFFLYGWIEDAWIHEKWAWLGGPVQLHLNFSTHLVKNLIWYGMIQWKKL